MVVTREIKELLKPEVLNTVRGLELVARIIVEGFMSGTNRSQTIGIGQEFSQYRSYEPGDDLRMLDWKMYARSERYFVKLAEIETNITVKFVLDGSHSMAYKEGSMSKFLYAKLMIAALSYLAVRQRDTIGLHVVNQTRNAAVEPRFEQLQFMRVLNELVLARASDTWEPGTGIDRIRHHYGKEMILFFTDMYDRDGDLLNFISGLKTKRNEVIVFHIMGEQERTMSYEGSFTFEDLETGNRMKGNMELRRREVAGRVNEWIEKTRGWMHEKQINYQLMLLNEPVEKSLFTFLTKRQRLAS